MKAFPAVGWKEQLRSALKIFSLHVLSQWLTNPTRKHELAGLIPGLAQWVKDLALL